MRVRWLTETGHLLKDMAALTREWGRFVVAPVAIPYKIALNRALDLEEACMRIAALTGDDVDTVKTRVMDGASTSTLSAAEIAARMTYVELSADNTFYDAFMSALFLPHTDMSLFPSVAKMMEGDG